MQKPRMVKCHNPECAKIFNEHTSPSGGVLFCTDTCEKRALSIRAYTVDVLTGQGFRLDQDVPNLWRKGATVVSLEYCMKHGVANVLAQFKQMDAAGGSRGSEEAPEGADR